MGSVSWAVRSPRDGYKSCPPANLYDDGVMRDPLRFVRSFVVDLFRSRAALLAENAMLRQQLIVAERKVVGRVRWTPWQRLAMVIAARFTPAWQTVNFLVQPATILRWHRAGFPPSGGDAHDGSDVRRRREPR
jgi:hypothetical protein